MSSRTDVDRPAMLVTAILAVVLIAASAPFTYLWWGEGTTTYEVDWVAVEETPAGRITLTGSGQGTPANVEMMDRLPAFVRVSTSQCADTPGLGNNPATITWALAVRHANGTTETLDGDTFQCPAGLDENHTRQERPTGLGAREVDSGSSDEERAAARAAVWDANLLGGLNETATYTLTASVNRPPGQLPGPLAQPSTLNVVLDLQVFYWEALLTETDADEVVR